MWTQAEISQQIRDTLLTYDPDISLDVGTPERKIIDAVSSVLASVQVDKFVTSYSNDINSKFGADLDDYVAQFGMARQAARAATGYITFSLGTPAQAPLLIPAGTLVAAPANATQSEIDFITKNDVVIATNTSNTQAIVEALVSGTIGNVAAGVINIIVSGINSPLSNITSVINYSPTAGGVDQETDAQLKIRFQNSIFRNIAGTLDQFLALTLSNSNITKATIVGPTSVYEEYVQLGNQGVVVSDNTSAKYIYNTNYYASSDGTDTAVFYSPGSASGVSVVVGGDYYWVNGGTAISNGNVTAKLQFNSVANPAPSGNAFAGSVLSVAQNSGGYLTGNYLWAFSYVYNPGGESSIGSAFPVGPTGGAQATALLSATANLYIPTGSGTSFIGNGVIVARNIYRSGDGGNTWGLIGSIFDNTTTQFADNNPVPTVVPPNQGLSSASVVYLNYQYLSQNSRNYINDASGTSVINKIDIYALGNNSQNASDVITGPGIQFVTDPTSKYYYKNYTRGYSTAQPSTANNFIQLTWTPIITIPSQIVINGNTYNQGLPITYTGAGSPVAGTVGDYWLVKDATNLRDSVQSREGIEITSAMGSAIGASIFPINYTFNDVCLLSQDIVDQHKQIGQDVLVHLARNRYFRINLVAIYDNGFSKISVDQSLDAILTAWFTNNQVFGNIIEPSSILQQVLNSNGINTARFAKSTDNSTYYGIQEVDTDGNPIGQIYDPGNATSSGAINLEDIEIPVFYDLGPNGPIQRSLNTWTS
jgi:hypothetical protein